MGLYFSVFRMRLQQQLQYRSEFLLNVIGDLLLVYIQISIWRSLLPSGNSSGTTAMEMATYTVVSFIMRNLTRSRFSMGLAEKVTTGSIAMDLIRPVNLKSYMFAEQLSQNLLTFLVSSVPVILVSALFFGMAAPASALMAFVFCVSAVLAILLMYTLDYTLGLTVFWLKNGIYPRMIMSGLFTIFSGSTVPLWFYPKWLADVSRFLPFRMVTFDPVQIYMGRITPAQALQTLGLQLAWLAAVTLINHIIWSKAKNLVFVQGG